MALSLRRIIRLSIVRSHLTIQILVSTNLNMSLIKDESSYSEITSLKINRAHLILSFI